MKFFKAEALLLLLTIQIGTLNASNSIDFSSISIAKTDTLDKCLHLIQSSGRVVIIDCPENNKLLEKPSINGLGNNQTISTSFYQLRCDDKVCVVYPKDEKLRSDFLSKNMISFAVTKSNLSDALVLLGKQAGTTLVSWGYGHGPIIPITLNIKNETVEQILVDMSVAYGSHRIVLSGGLDNQGQRDTGLTLVQFQ